MHNAKVVNIVYSGKLRKKAWKKACQKMALRTAPEEILGSLYVHDFSKGRVHVVKHI